MYYSWIKYNDTANGPGVRISLFVSGCTNRCKGCFNKETWDFKNGKPFTKETEDKILTEMALPRYSGITVLGGEPFELENQPAVLEFLQRFKTEFPNKTIWMFSGFTYDKDLAPFGKRYVAGQTDKLLDLADVLVDGRFDENLKDISLSYRGSSNQRLIDLKKSTYENIILYEVTK